MVGRRKFIKSIALLSALPFVAKLLPEVKAKPVPNAQYVESRWPDNPQYGFGFTGFKPASPAIRVGQPVYWDSTRGCVVTNGDGRPIGHVINGRVSKGDAVMIRPLHLDDR